MSREFKPLNEEELKAARAFIRSRGMKQPDVVNEILDHFACKIEEVLNENNQMPFERAMELAHKSFGVSGFRPIQKSYEEKIEQLISSNYKLAAYEILRSPSILFAFFFSISIFYLLQYLPDSFYNHWFFGVRHWVGILPTICMALAGVFFNYQNKKKLLGSKLKKLKLNYWEYRQSGMQSHTFLVLIIVGMSCVNSTEAPSYIFFIFGAIISFFSLANAIAQYKVKKKLEQLFAPKN